MQWSVFVVSDAGMVRSRNEDMAAVGPRLFRNESEEWTEHFSDPPRSFAAAVADGVGGSAAGDVASKITLEGFTAAVDALDAGLSPQGVQQALRSIAADMHGEVTRQGMLHSERQGMATTLSSFVWYQGRPYLVHAGDSRLYLFRDGALTQLTRDHTLREFTGNTRIPGNILVNCVGVERDFFTDVRALENIGRSRDLLLACTDGLTDTVPPRDISAVLHRYLGGTDAGGRSGRWSRASNNAGSFTSASDATLRRSGDTESVSAGSPNLRSIGNELLSRANAAGAHDNVTFILIYVV
jgi:protein phosphatase